MSVEELRALEAAWSASQPHRARGGSVSLSGFAFQLHSTIAAVVRAWIADPTSIAPIAEAVSDLITLDREGRMTVTQIKRTGRSTAVADAMAELWTIEVVAAREMPDLLDRLAYEIRCFRWELKDAGPIIARWEPDEETAAGADVERFRARVSASTDPDPLADVLVLLSAELRDPAPLATVHRWVGHLMGDIAVGRPDSAQALFSDLSGLRNRAETLPDGVHVVDTSCAEPTTVEPGGYLIGKQPQLRHLAEGWFAPRDWQVVPATEALVDWLSSAPDSTDDQRRLPCFWIEGRSGSGKSILTLQVLARLVEMGHGPIAYLGSRHHLVGPAVQWARGLADGRTPIVVVDDPFGPGDPNAAREQWQPAFDALVGLRESGARLPVLVACGPREQSAGFERTFADDVQVERWVLDEQRDVAHEAELEAWFTARSGRTAPSLSGDVLMVQRFFEWRTGEVLGTFAARFQSRVASLDPTGALEELVARLLAANRLYAGMPEGLLGELADSTRDALARLEADGHVTVDREHEGRPGVWLTHPHLADALFRGWFPDEAVHERAGALREAALDAARVGTTPEEQTSVLWALAAALDHDGSEALQERLDEAILAETLDQVFERWPRSDGRLRLSHLPAWVRLVARVPDTRAAADVFASVEHHLTTATADEDVPAFSLTCLTVLRVADRLPPETGTALLAGMRTMLDRAPDWPPWVVVATKLSQVTQRVDDARRLLDRAALDPSAPWVPRALDAAASCGELEDEIAALGELGAQRAGGTSEWGRYLSEAISTRPSAVVVAGAWAWRHRTAFAAARTISQLLVVRGDPVDVETAQRWLEVQGDAPQASYVVQALVARGAPPPGSMEELARTWIDSHPNDPGASFVLEAVIDVGLGHDPPTFDEAHAIRWVRENPDAAGWAFPFLRLLAILDRAQIDRLLPIAVTWLREQGRDPSWGYVYQRLFEEADEALVDQLVDVGIARLQEPGDVAEWSYTFEGLLRRTTDDARRRLLVGLGTAHLAEHPDRSDWSFTFGKLRDLVVDPTDRAALRSVGRDWLAGHEEHSGWSHVYQALFDLGPAPEERAAVVQVGVDWVTDLRDDAKWAFVFQRVIAEAPADGRGPLVDLGLRWLRDHADMRVSGDDQPARKDWSHTFGKLVPAIVDEEQAEEARRLGTLWLSRQPENPGWPHVFRLVLPTATDTAERSTLVELGTSWLAAHADHRFSFNVTAALKEADRADRRARMATGLPGVRVGERYQGTVVNTIAYGVFVDIGAVVGLIHRSQLPLGVGQGPDDLFSVGDVMEVEVTDVDVEQLRLALGLVEPAAAEVEG